MGFHIDDRLDGPEGERAIRLYHESFPKAGRKPDPIIRGTFDKKLGWLITESSEEFMAAMAFAGSIPHEKLLLIDYLAVAPALRGKGIGRRFVRDIAEWAKNERGLRGILLEAEADPGEENAGRMAFWERCGFILTDYVHEYRWVPETYRAMYLPFDPDFRTEDRGESLFRHIEWFHKKAFSR